MAEGKAPETPRVCRGEKTGNYYMGVLGNLEQGLIPDEGWIARAREWVVRASRDWLSYSMAALVFWFCSRPEEARRALDRALDLQEEKTSLFFLLAAGWQERKNMAGKWLERYLTGENSRAVTGDLIYVLDLWSLGGLDPVGENQLARALETWQETLEQDGETEARQLSIWKDCFRRWREEIALPEGDQFQYLGPLPGTTAGNLLQGALLGRPAGDFLKRHRQKKEPWQEPYQARRQLLENFLWSECVQTPAAIWQGTWSDFCTFWLRRTEEEPPETVTARVERLLLGRCRRWLRRAFDDVTGETARLVPGGILFQYNYSFRRQNHQFACTLQDGLEENQAVARAREDLDAFLEPERKQADWRPAAVKNLLPWALFGGVLFWKGPALITEYGTGVLVVMGILGFLMGSWLGAVLAVALAVGAGMALQSLVAYGSAGILCWLVFLALLAFRQFWLKQDAGKRFQEERQQVWASLEGMIRGSCAEVADFRDHYAAYCREQENVRQQLDSLEAESELTTGRRIRRG